MYLSDKIIFSLKSVMWSLITLIVTTIFLYGSVILMTISIGSFIISGVFSLPLVLIGIIVNIIGWIIYIILFIVGIRKTINTRYRNYKGIYSMPYLIAYALFIEPFSTLLTPFKNVYKETDKLIY